MTIRKKPKQRRSRQLVDAVLSATSIVASRSGLEEATVENISEKAGVSVGSVYQYFSTKETVLGESAATELEQNRRAVLAKIGAAHGLSTREFVATVIEFVAAYFQSRIDKSQHIFALSSEVGRLDDHMRMRNEVIAAVATVFRGRRDLVVGDPHKAAAVVVHSIMGAFTAPMIDKSFPWSIAELKSEVSAMIMRYLLGPGA